MTFLNSSEKESALKTTIFKQRKYCELCNTKRDTEETSPPQFAGVGSVSEFREAGFIIHQESDGQLCDCLDDSAPGYTSSVSVAQELGRLDLAERNRRFLM
ncbi:hypothetical protein RRG08_050379 [Elysia crispata]|uniref:Uncharacterized protein n=1 Tax=Elysia crispata TaxID=231223 RepID=A0AAE0YVW7_9GAST|nr:hypothetical protein RRG08_050379 [Elysia crispata]